MENTLLRVGVCETTFARFEMGAAAIDELQNLGTDIKIVHSVVPGVKDLPVAAKKLIE